MNPEHDMCDIKHNQGVSRWFVPMTFQVVSGISLCGDAGVDSYCSDFMSA